MTRGPASHLLGTLAQQLYGTHVLPELARTAFVAPLIGMTAAENARRFLAKPFDLNDLLDTVERYRDRGGRLN